MSCLRRLFSIILFLLIVIVFIIFLLFALLQRNGDDIYDFSLQGRYAYLANGRMGIRTISLDDPTNLVEVGQSRCGEIIAPEQPDLTNLKNCVRNAQQLWIQEDRLYLAQGRLGISVYDLSIDPENPYQIGQLALPFSVQDLVVIDELIYLSTNQDGIRLVRISEKDRGGAAPQNTPLVELKLLEKRPFPDLEDGGKLFFDGEFLYWIQDRGILHVIDPGKDGDLKEKSTYSNEHPFLDLVFLDSYALVAGGEPGFIVLDTSNPNQLSEVTRLLFNENPVVGIDQIGAQALVSVENQGLVTLDLSYIKHPSIIKKDFPIQGRPGPVKHQGEYGYILRDSDRLVSFSHQVILESEFISKSGAPLLAKDVFQVSNYSFVAGAERGLRVLDVSDPRRISEIAYLDTPGRADGIAVSGNVAYIADRTNGLLLADLTNLSGNLPILKQLESEDARAIAVSGNFAFLADFEEGLMIFDISVPISSTLVKVMDPVDGAPLNPVGITLLGDYAYLAGGEQGLHVVNILDKNIPTEIVRIIPVPAADVRNVAVVAYTQPAFQISGQDPFQVDPRDPKAQLFAYVANGQHGLKVYDITNVKEKPVVEIPLDEEIIRIPGVVMDVAIDRDRAYLAVDGSGVFVLDTTNPGQPKYLGYINLSATVNKASSLVKQGSLLYLAGLENGLQIFRDSVSAPELLGQYAAPAAMQNMVVQDEYAYAVDGSRGLWIFSLSDPKRPQEVSYLSIAQATGVSVVGDYVFVAAGQNGLVVVNSADRKLPEIIARLDTDGTAQAVVVAQKPGRDPEQWLAYLSDGAAGLVVIDVSDPGAPFRIGALGLGGQAGRFIYTDREYLFIVVDQRELAVISLVDPRNPTQVDRITDLPAVYGTAIVAGNTAYLASGPYGAYLYDISYPLNVVQLPFVEQPDNQWIENVAVAVSNPISGTITETMTVPPNYAFLAELERGVRILDTTDPSLPFVRGVITVSEQRVGGEKLANPPQFAQIIADWIPPNLKKSANGGKFVLYVLDRANGFNIYEATKATNHQILDVHETGAASGVRALLDYLRAKARPGGVPSIRIDQEIQQFLVQFVGLGILGVFFWLAFLTMFILPVRDFRTWESLYTRLVLFLFGRHGPLLRVRDGRLASEEGQLDRRGPGLLLVDAVSAAVLERRNVLRRADRQAIPDQAAQPLFRVAEPGIAFLGNRSLLTRPVFDEVLRGVVDLRRQVRIATGVHLYTRDGIEVETNVFSIFTLGEEPDVIRVMLVPPEKRSIGETSLDEINPVTAEPAQVQPPWRAIRVLGLNLEGSGWRVTALEEQELDDADLREIHQFIISSPPLNVLTPQQDQAVRQRGQANLPFTRDPVRLFHAVLAQADDTFTDEQIDWRDLPEMITIERLRNSLAAEAHDSLYDPLNASNFPILRLKKSIRLWGRNQGVLAYQVVRLVDGRNPKVGDLIPERELLASEIQVLTNPKVLRSRGIKVRFAGFSELTPTNPRVRDQFFDYWQAQRERDADFVLGDFDLRASRETNQWRLEAQKEILKEFTQLLEAERYPDEVLAMHVLSTLERAVSDTETSLMLPEDTLQMLQNLRDWLKPGANLGGN